MPAVNWFEAFEVGPSVCLYVNIWQHGLVHACMYYGWMDGWMSCVSAKHICIYVMHVSARHACLSTFSMLAARLHALPSHLLHLFKLLHVEQHLALVPRHGLRRLELHATRPVLLPLLPPSLGPPIRLGPAPSVAPILTRAPPPGRKRRLGLCHGRRALIHPLKLEPPASHPLLLVLVLCL